MYDGGCMEDVYEEDASCKVGGCIMYDGGCMDDVYVGKEDAGGVVGGCIM